MTAAHALKSARAVGIRVRIDGDDLAARGPLHKPPQAVLDLLSLPQGRHPEAAAPGQ